ncbi:MAG TPA: SAV_6107 family HEPN domain-containing protein [Mycobacteriales bacterium]|nr:SAV_6107 family HEPN domain-containing protein [Mycobacteriales bacterium]HVX69304.1 SAV_6107 family HEPN domain-containing protein [Mycobacteriales bacterium]
MTAMLDTPVRAPAPGHTVPASALRLAVAARRALGEAEQAREVGERYAEAHLAALRAAAAVLAAEARPEVDRPLRRGRPTSVWTLLVRVAPELAEWAAFFAAGADKRVAAQAGMRGAVTAREADDLVRDAGLFLDLVAARLGLPAVRQTMLPLEVAVAGPAPVYPANPATSRQAKPYR